MKSIERNPSPLRVVLDAALYYVFHFLYLGHPSEILARLWLVHDIADGRFRDDTEDTGKSSGSRDRERELKAWKMLDDSLRESYRAIGVLAGLIAAAVSALFAIDQYTAQTSIRILLLVSLTSSFVSAASCISFLSTVYLDPSIMKYHWVTSGLVYILVLSGPSAWLSIALWTLQAALLAIVWLAEGRIARALVTAMIALRLVLKIWSRLASVQFRVQDFLGELLGRKQGMNHRMVHVNKNTITIRNRYLQSLENILLDIDSSTSKRNAEFNEKIPESSGWPNVPAPLPRDHDRPATRRRPELNRGSGTLPTSGNRTALGSSIQRQNGFPVSPSSTSNDRPVVEPVVMNFLQRMPSLRRAPSPTTEDLHEIMPEPPVISGEHSFRPVKNPTAPAKKTPEPDRGKRTASGTHSLKPRRDTPERTNQDNSARPKPALGSSIQRKNGFPVSPPTTGYHRPLVDPVVMDFLVSRPLAAMAPSPYTEDLQESMPEPPVSGDHGFRPVRNPTAPAKKTPEPDRGKRTASGAHSLKPRRDTPERTSQDNNARYEPALGSSIQRRKGFPVLPPATSNDRPVVDPVVMNFLQRPAWQARSSSTEDLQPSMPEPPVIPGEYTIWHPPNAPSRKTPEPDRGSRTASGTHNSKPRRDAPSYIGRTPERNQEDSAGSKTVLGSSSTQRHNGFPVPPPATSNDRFVVDPVVMDFLVPIPTAIRMEPAPMPSTEDLDLKRVVGRRHSIDSD
ncbi:hypothetical protein D9758_007917 [Tetrapyrgos nigripes]|uniref:Uncharacterized protein n=1 Tax=Tetrapyrgos nigripes TaxID=182062 RepID=A0A8H5FY12_9AGAR|nr:hypothetical protein D9758_007917 [Tetrapyrgos nigripes]